MKKYLTLLLAVMLATLCSVGCSSSQNSKHDADQIKAIFANTGAEQETEVSELETPSTVYLNSTRSGAITKAANPVIGINFDVLDNNYEIEKTNSNFRVDPIYGGGDPFYVMFDSPDEIVIGDFEYGFATAISTKWEDLLHIYDLENELVYKVVTPLDTNRIKKIGDAKFAIQCGSAADGYKTYSFSTSETYAYDLYMNDDDVVVIVDGGHEYDVAKELAQESEGATTTPEEAIEVEQHSDNGVENTTDDTATAAETLEGSSKLHIISEDDVEEDDSSANIAAQNTDVSEETDVAETSEEQMITEDVNDSAHMAEETEENTSDALEQPEVVTDSVEEQATALSEEEEEIETTVVQMANDTAAPEVSEDQIYVAEETEDVPTHTDIPGGRIINVPVIAQFPYYPSGCESVSTVMALQYHGVDISVDDFINKYLDQDTGFYIKDGLKFGPSPFEFFIGSPYDNSGLGCMSPVIYNALMKIYDYNRSKVVNVDGLSMEDLCMDYLNHDLPVMVWVNICMTEAFDSNTWHLEDGTEYIWQANEHCMLLVGYDEYNYYFNDPYTGAVVSYSKSESERCYEQQGMQAVVILE